MKILSKPTIKGHVTIYKNGEKVYEDDNLVVKDGLIESAKALAQESADMPVAMALGDDDTDPSSDDSSLKSEFYREEIGSTSRSDTSVTFENTFEPGDGEGYVREIGLFSDTADESGTMFARISVDERNKTSSDELTVVWTIDFQAS